MHALHVGIIGLGAMGSALARALHAGARASASAAPDSAVRLVAISSRRRDAAELLSHELGDVTVVTPAAMAAHVDLILLTVGDGELAAMANHQAFVPGLTVVHTSGALDLSVLQAAADRGAAVGSFHPMVSVVRNAAAPARFAGAVVAVDAGGAARAGEASGIDDSGHSARAERRNSHADQQSAHADQQSAHADQQSAHAKHTLVSTQLSALANALGMTPLTVAAEHRARWHAAATLVGNSSAALLAHAEHLLRDLPGDPAVRRAALLGLLNSVVHGLSALPATTALHSGIAGPIARGNSLIVERHLAALQESGERAAYRHAASLVLLAVAHQLPTESSAALARLLAPVDLT